MEQFRRSILGILFGGMFFWTAGAYMAPLVHDSHPLLSAVTYMIYMPFCHQDTSRSFQIAEAFCAVCVRCSGIYTGILLALGLLRKKRSPLSRNHAAIVIVMGLLPTAIDVAVTMMGLWDVPATIRFVNGAIAGALVASVIVPELLTAIISFTHTRSTKDTLHVS